jgi:hypothetical protein
MWVEKFKSPTVTRTNRVGRIVTRTKRGWTKRQGTGTLYVHSSHMHFTFLPFLTFLSLFNFFILSTPRSSRNSNSHTWHFHRLPIPSLLIALLPTTMLLPPYCRLPLTVRWLKPDFARDFPADLPPPPLHMPIVFGPVLSRKIVAAKATQKQPRCVFPHVCVLGKYPPPSPKAGDIDLCNMGETSS